MYTKDALLRNKTGLHARPASVFVDMAKKFESKILVENLDDAADGSVNAKSIVMLLSLGLSGGTRIRISANGEDENVAVDALVQLVENEFAD